MKIIILNQRKNEIAIMEIPGKNVEVEISEKYEDFNSDCNYMECNNCTTVKNTFQGESYSAVVLEKI